MVCLFVCLGFVVVWVFLVCVLFFSGFRNERKDNSVAKQALLQEKMIFVPFRKIKPSSQMRKKSYRIFHRVEHNMEENSDATFTC